MFTSCRQEHTITSPNIHKTWKEPSSPALYVASLLEVHLIFIFVSIVRSFILPGVVIIVVVVVVAVVGALDPQLGTLDGQSHV